MLLGAVEATNSKRAHSTALILAGRGSSAGTSEDDVASYGRSLDEQDNMCVQRDSNCGLGGEEEARIRQNASSIVEKDGSHSYWCQFGVEVDDDQKLALRVYCSVGSYTE